MMNGTGGQPETHIGAFLCPGGRAITLLQSTAVGGAISRIVPQLEAGALVTVPRYFADTVVTEFGIARLLGKNHRERANELIAIAHPDHRAELKRSRQPTVRIDSQSSYLLLKTGCPVGPIHWQSHISQRLL